MRSVFVFLCDASEEEVSAHLDHTYPTQREPWLSSVGDDPYLYIDFYREGPTEFEPEEWSDLVERCNGKPPVGVMADVSGRHPGDQQALDFVTNMLTHFNGFAMDDYTEHLWSLEELRTGIRVLGHPFFDYDGWWLERGSTWF